MVETSPFVKDKRIEELEVKANDALNKNLRDDAIVISEEGIALSEKYNEKADVAYFKGILHYSKNELDKALKFLTDAVTIDENFVLAHYNLGNLLSDLKKFEEAKKEYLKVIEIDPNFSEAYYNLGILLKNLKNYNEAIKYFNAALKIYEKENSSKVIDTKWWLKNLEDRKTKKTEKTIEQDVIDSVVEELKDKKDRLFKQINDKEKQFKDFISSTRTITPDKNFFIVLRRWNSYTPALSSELERSKGGGYFLSWMGKGLVIDPGFNFIENFITQGFKIADIDAIILTHSHLDHTVDFESLMTLIHEHNEETEEKKLVDIFMNIGSLNKFISLISVDNKAIRKIYSLDPGDVKNLKDYHMNLIVTKSKHREIGGDIYSVGLIFELMGAEGKKTFRLGLTSDTGYTKEIGAQYEKCDMLVAHLGSVKEKEFNLDIAMDERLYKTHLGLIGTTRVIKEANPKFAIISEFGEELGELRVDIVKALDKVLKTKRMKKCIAGDIGLKVTLPEIGVRCDWCTREAGKDFFVPMEEINAMYIPEREGKEIGKIMYLCKKHF